MLGFTFNEEDFINCRAWVRKEGTGRYVPGGKKNEEGIPRELLPAEERWSGRHFQLEDVFCQLGDDATTLDLSYYFDASSFDGYKQWAASQIEISKPPVEKWIEPSRYKKSLLEFE